jgi:hypothetical protein
MSRPNMSISARESSSWYHCRHSSTCAADGMDHVLGHLEDRELASRVDFAEV